MAAYVNCERLVARLTRPSVARLLLNNRSLPTVAARRNDSIFTKYREPPNGFLFNEKPLKPGERRQWEDWEAIWYVGWGVSFFLFFIGAVYKPEPAYLNEAKAEAERRLAEFDAADAEEAGNIENSSETLLAVDFEDDSDE